MSVYNSQDYLVEAIDSILNQSFEDFEFLIINDGSTDDSVSIIKQYQDPRIQLIENPTNIGLTKSLNLGIDSARGEYLARMDADDIALPQRFEKQMAYLLQHKNIVLLGTGKIDISADGKVIANKPALSSAERLKALLFFHNTFCHPSIIGKTEIFRKYKYDEAIPVAQDYHLWNRIAQEHPVDNLKQALLKYRVHASSISQSKRDKQLAVVRLINAEYFQALGLDEHKLDLHLKIGNLDNHYVLATKELKEISAWLKLLCSKNLERKVFTQAGLDFAIARRWTALMTRKNTKLHLKDIGLVLFPNLRLAFPQRIIIFLFYCKKLLTWPKSN